jgi:hypothetical protein
MPTIDYNSAATFIWANARLLDRRRFAYYFLGEPAGAVIDAIKAYQNPDGGFGNALEPDKRDPHSQPVDVQVAFHVLDDLGMMGDTEVQRALVLPACDFLAAISHDEGGVPFALPTTHDYPHAPWWEVGDNPPANINPTADLVGLLLKHGIQHPWLERAVSFCWSQIEGSETDDFHALIPIISFLEHAPDRDRAEPELERTAERIAAHKLVEYDPSAAGYVKMPLDWAPTPQSYLRRLFDEQTIQAHLEAYAARQGADGGWPISWDPVSKGVELEWRGMLTVDALLMLKANGVSLAF